MVREISLQQNKILPAAVTLFICILLAILIWRLLGEEHRNDQKELLKIHAETFASYVTTDISDKLPSLGRMAHRWAERGGTPKNEFEADALHYIDDIPGIKAIE